MAQAFYYTLVGQQLFVMVTVSGLQIFFNSQARVITDPWRGVA
jgi:hypothetical protein